ncbi:nonribosomal peptide synthetase 12 [Auricularia subglabra TFB-10046 SS5]|nr:nonribosomal peptide synthetase 12 [Auricularia subglabra TFB-10046 SS5]
MHEEQISHLTPLDRDLFVHFGFGERRAAPFTCIHAAFEHHARLQPDAIAVEHLDQSISYAALNARADKLACRLRTLGIRPGARVCLLVQRSIPMVVGILATLKAGGAYVPLDGGIVTDSTLEHVLNDSGAVLVLALRDFTHRVASHRVICIEDVIEEDLNTAAAHPVENLSSTIDPIYIIYTSGERRTTGKPKGVEVTHRNVTNLVCQAPGNIGMRAGLRVAQLLNVAFDMCAWEVLGALSNGCTLCLRGKTSKEWRALMKTVDIIISTPSILGQHDPVDYPNVKAVATAGEACPQSLADKWSKTAQFYNSCGPTEVTIVNTVFPHTYGVPLSIGRPVPNTNVYVLDENLIPLPIGEPGMMWAGGACVSRGYLNLPDKTAERYKRDPFVDDGSMMFNTGDIGRWRADGTLEHLGRADDQVKVKGFRVELDGVAAAMESTSGVTVAAAMLIANELWGFYAPAGVKEEDVKAATARVQPYYAVPTRFLPLEQFPHTSNGKNDKRALRKLAEDKLAEAKPPAVETKPVMAEVKPAAASPTVSRKPAPTAEEVKPRRVLDFKPYVATKPDPEKRPYPIARSSFNTSTTTLPGELWLELIAPAIAAPAYGHHELEWHPYKSTSRSSSAGSTVGPASIESLPKLTADSTTEKTEYTKALEEGHGWEGYLEQELPEKSQGKWARNVRHQVFTLYRRMFGVVFVVNFALLITVLVRGANAQRLGLITIANLFCAILMRQEYVVNAFFDVFCAVPTSWPLAIRRVCARVYHIGGLHSGCAISGTLWLMYFTAQATIEMTQQKVSVPTVVVTYLILGLLFAIILFAWPKFRLAFHDRFERTHRFMGWTTTAFVWAQVVLLTNDYKLPGQPLHDALKRSAPFWMVVVMTGSIVLPWLRLRKVAVRADVLSNHAVRLYFNYVTPVPGTYTRISESPLLEWHSFATVAEPGKTGYSLVVSRAGDWTGNQIANPPTHLWVRGIPTCGVLRIVPLFRRLVFVATGSGIGPCAPCILEQRVPIRLLWTSPDVRKTFGDKFVDSILEKSPDAVVYDTRKHGKPDMVKMTYKLVEEFKAEAVCIISNQKLTRKVVYGMVSRGIPAFGAIWDS